MPNWSYVAGGTLENCPETSFLHLFCPPLKNFVFKIGHHEKAEVTPRVKLVDEKSFLFEDYNFFWSDLVGLGRSSPGRGPSIPLSVLRNSHTP